MATRAVKYLPKIMCQMVVLGIVAHILNQILKLPDPGTVRLCYST